MYCGEKGGSRRLKIRLISSMNSSWDTARVKNYCPIGTNNDLSHISNIIIYNLFWILYIILFYIIFYKFFFMLLSFHKCINIKHNLLNMIFIMQKIIKE